MESQYVESFQYSTSPLDHSDYIYQLIDFDFVDSGSWHNIDYHHLLNWSESIQLRHRLDINNNN